MEEETHQHHHQNHRRRRIMTESAKILVASLLLIFVSIGSLVSNTPKIVQSGKTVQIPCMEIVNEVAWVNCKTENPYTLPLEWFIKGLSNKLIPVILFIIFIINPKFPLPISFMWLFYFAFIVLDWILFFERLPWRYTIDIFICIGQSAYLLWYTIFENDGSA